MIRRSVSLRSRNMSTGGRLRRTSRSGSDDWHGGAVPAGTAWDGLFVIDCHAKQGRCLDPRTS